MAWLAADWIAAADGYRERVGPGLWAEPLNLVSNAAFPAAALSVWPRTKGQPAARALAVMLAAVGLGSALFHSFANRLTALADMLPILVFILIYLYAANRRMLGLAPLWSALAMLAFLPYAALTASFLSRLIPGLGSSAGYAAIPVRALAYAALMARKAPATARRMAAGAAPLSLSILARSIDMPLCSPMPTGTHLCGGP